jgi:hypothetical protein
VEGENFYPHIGLAASILLIAWVESASEPKADLDVTAADVRY